MIEREVFIPGRVVPKARPRFDPRSGRAYTEGRYADWLEMASQTVALTLRQPLIDSPVFVRTAFSPGGVEVAILEAPKPAYRGVRGDIDNMTGSVFDALQKGFALVNDHRVVRSESWIV